MWEPFIGMFLAIVATVIFFFVLYASSFLIVKGGFTVYEKMQEEYSKHRERSKLDGDKK